MKVREQKHLVNSQGFEEVFDFEIKASAQSFAVLIDKLYTDPILAIIRELSANAWDAHIDAKNETIQFDIHLPSINEPYFIIRDYGTGISYQKMIDVYRIIFESDKTKSNDTTGCFGLGCKTPLAYTDNYIIESFINGRHYIYNGYIGEDGKPKLAVQIKKGVLSSEPNGLKITIAIKLGDENVWLTKSQSVYRYFQMQPNFIGSVQPIVQLRKCTLKKNNWAIYDDHENMVAVMGNIAYPIKSNQIDHKLSSVPIEITFELGSLDITPSRDDLQYTTKTKLHIKNELDKIQKELSKELDKKLGEVKNLWEARIIYLNIQDSLPSYLTDQCVEWNDIVLFPNPNYYSKNMVSLKGINSYRYYSKADEKYGEIREITKIYHGSGMEATAIDSIKPTSNITFVNVDEKTNFIVKAKYFQTNNSNRKVIICKFDEDIKKEEFIKLLGIDESYFTNTSDMDKPTSVSPLLGKKRGKTANICRYSSISIGNKSSYWKNEQVDINKGGFFVELNRYEFKHGKTFYSPKKLKVMLDELEVLGYPVEVVYGIKTAVLNKSISKGNGWRDFIKYYNERKRRFNYDHFTYLDDDRELYKLLRTLPKKHYLCRKYLKSIMCNSVQDYSHFKRDSNTVNLNREEIVDKYPLLGMMLKDTKRYYNITGFDDLTGVQLRDLGFYVTQIDKVLAC